MITLSELRERYSPTADEEKFLPKIKDAIVTLWEQQTGLLWSRRVDYVDRLTPAADRTRAIWTSIGPIESISKVEEKSSYTKTWTELSIDDYEIAGPRRINKINSYWLEHVRITLTGGYTESPASGADPAQFATPAFIKDAIITQAIFLRTRNAIERIHISSQNFEGGQGVFLPGDIHPLFKLAAQSNGAKELC